MNKIDELYKLGYNQTKNQIYSIKQILKNKS